MTESDLDKTRNKGVRTTVICLLGVVLLVLAMVYNKFTTPRVMTELELQESGVLIFEKPRKLPPIELLNQDGQPFTNKDFVGQWTVLFFGFTQCPDVCPTTLAEMKQLYGLLDGYMQKQVSITLMSLDPERDTAEALKPYMAYFHEDFVGLTAADVNATARAARAFNVAHMKQPQGDSYTIDHSAHLAIVNPKGHYHGLIKPPFDPAKLVWVLKSLEGSF